MYCSDREDLICVLFSFVWTSGEVISAGLEMDLQYASMTTDALPLGPVSPFNRENRLVIDYKTFEFLFGKGRLEPILKSREFRLGRAVSIRQL